MIAQLTGRIGAIAEGTVVIDVGGVGYLVSCSTRTLARLSEGTDVSLRIETQWREDGPHLFGFIEAAERRWFRLLLAIPGVGSKLALAILGSVAPDDLARAIAADDRAALMRAPGVGAKLATRIASELKDKAGAVPSTATGAAVLIAGDVPAAGSAADAVSALVNLGFRLIEAQSAVAAAVGRLGADAPVEALIRGGLGELAQKEARR